MGIIVPIYDVEKYLAHCLDSIVNQTYKDLVIVLVDDGSKDASYEIAKSYYDKDERIILIKSKNAGVGVARNIGMKVLAKQSLDEYKELRLPQIKHPPKNDEMLRKNARVLESDELKNLENDLQILKRGDFGEVDYIKFVDSDDWISLDCIEKCLDVVREDPSAQIVWHDNQDHDEFKGISQKSPVIDKLGLDHNRRYSGLDVFNALYRPHFTWVASGIVKFSHILKNDLFFEENIVLEDELFCRKLFSLSDSIYIIKDVCYHYRIRPNSNCQYGVFTVEERSKWRIPSYKAPILRYCDHNDMTDYFGMYSNVIISTKLLDFVDSRSDLDPRVIAHLKKLAAYKIGFSRTLAYFLLKNGDPYGVKEMYLSILQRTNSAKLLLWPLIFAYKALQYYSHRNIFLRIMLYPYRKPVRVLKRLLR